MTIATLRLARILALPAVIGLMLATAGTTRTTLAQPPAAVPGATAVSQPVVVINDATPLRPEDAEVYYPAALAKAGTLLRADLTKGDWVRVTYPAGAKAIVLASDAGLDGTVVRLTKPSRLIAVHAGMAALEGYMPLLAAELAPGTVLKFVENGKLGDKAVYVVSVPAEARAWVPRTMLRQATPEEAAKLEPAAAPTTPAAPATPSTPATPTAPTTPTSVPGGTPGATPSTTPTPTAPGTPSADPMVPADPAAPTEPTTPPPPPPPPAKAPELVKAEALIEVFDRLRSQPMADNETEYNAALGEMRAHANSLGDSPRNRAIRRGLENRAQALELLADNARFRREQRERLGALDKQRSAAGQQLAALEAQRVYAYIGRLVPSAVYDGQRLPLMYRVQSPEPGSFRTLGYLLPNQLELGGKLGTVVGIQGEGRFDDALKAVIITPTRVDVVSLNPLPGQSSSSSGATPAAEPAPAPAPAPVPEKP